MPDSYHPCTELGQDAIQRAKRLMKSLATDIQDEELRKTLMMKVQTIANEVLEMDHTITDVKKTVSDFFNIPADDSTDDPFDELADARDALSTIGKLVED